MSNGTFNSKSEYLKQRLESFEFESVVYPYGTVK